MGLRVVEYGEAKSGGCTGLLDLAHHGGTDANVIDVVLLKSLANMRKSVFRSHETFLGIMVHVAFVLNQRKNNI